MSKERPNILLIMTDQQRGDCLGVDGHPVVQTPNMDSIAGMGVRCSHAYTACPICMPARRTLMSGQKPFTHGALGNQRMLLEGPTLPGELSKAGYQTHLVGKLHLHPERKRYGFDSMELADGTSTMTPHSDYARFLREQGINIHNAGVAHGVSGNGWVGRPFHLDDRYHHTNWCVDRAMDFLERRDPTAPFFLKVSFHKPHPPCTPPRYYYDMYMSMDLPEPYVGDWARVFDQPPLGLPVDTWRLSLPPIVMKQFRAAYYGCITHIDDQIGRLLQVIPENTIIVFCSDHGEMLGDHQWLRKSNAFEPSARIPFLMKFPKSMRLNQPCVIEEPVELMDIMPTLLDAVGIEIPNTVEGMSILPLLRGEKEWREYVHGEMRNIPPLDSGMQYITNGKRKYIWYPGNGDELYFDLENDPHEMHNLMNNTQYSEEIAYWRSMMIKELEGRPEGFTDGKRLISGVRTKR